MRVQHGLFPDVFVGQIGAGFFGDGFYCPDVEVLAVLAVRVHGKQILCKTVAVSAELVHFFCGVSFCDEDQVHVVFRIPHFLDGVHVPVILTSVADDFGLRINRRFVQLDQQTGFAAATVHEQFHLFFRERNPQRGGHGLVHGLGLGRCGPLAEQRVKTFGENDFVLVAEFVHIVSVSEGFHQFLLRAAPRSFVVVAGQVYVLCTVVASENQVDAQTIRSKEFVVGIFFCLEFAHGQQGRQGHSDARQYFLHRTNGRYSCEE